MDNPSKICKETCTIVEKRLNGKTTKRPARKKASGEKARALACTHTHASNRMADIPF